MAATSLPLASGVGACQHQRRRRLLPEAAEWDIDEDEVVALSDKFEVAALPSTTVPRWAARIRDAIGDAERRCLQTGWGGPGPLDAVDVEAEAAKLQALRTTAMWGVEPLPLYVIEALAKRVTKEGLWLPA
jgi:hypothetical protein